jgi:hypothetical protein
MAWNSTAPAVAPSIDEALEPLVEAVAHPDPATRRARVECVLRTCLPQVIRLLAGRLVDRWLGATPPGCGPALAALVQLGRPAACVVADRLTDPGARAVRARLADLLAAIGEKLPAADRADLHLDLGIAGRLAAGQDERRAIARAVAVLRRADEGASRPASPRSSARGP